MNGCMKGLQYHNLQRHCRIPIILNENDLENNRTFLLYIKFFSGSISIDFHLLKYVREKFESWQISKTNTDIAALF